jgi:hypothetical protein
MQKKGRRGMGMARTYNSKAALNQFYMFFPGRLEQATTSK